ncbi:MAG: hypothetical protein R2939_14355 [Kofleriaceae bacterium]
MRLAAWSTLTLLAFAAGCTTAAEVDDAWDVVDGKGDGGRALAYGELARTKVGPALARVIEGLAVIDDDVRPDEPKAVRKQLAELRDYVDLFAYAYSTKHGDPWRELRDQLDDGYELIGAFKDLFDRQGVEDPAAARYDEDEVDERRAPVVAWTEAFLDADAREAAEAYLGAPSTTKLYPRDRDDLSPYFWAGAELEPKLSRSGLKNLGRLSRALLELAEDDYDEVLDLRDLHEEDNQEVFHSFRKRIRGQVRAVAYFPELVDPEADVAAQLATLTELVDRYGAVNDLIARYAAAHERDDDDLEDELEDEIRDAWRELRTWQRDADIDDVLDDVHDALRH